MKTKFKISLNKEHQKRNEIISTEFRQAILSDLGPSLFKTLNVQFESEDCNFTLETVTYSTIFSLGVLLSKRNFAILLEVEEVNSNAYISASNEKEFGLFSGSGIFMNVFESEKDANKVARILGKGYTVRNVTGEGY
jgi:hypothetical protein